MGFAMRLPPYYSYFRVWRRTPGMMSRMSVIDVLLLGGSTHANPGERVVPPESRTLSVTQETVLAIPSSHIVYRYYLDLNI